MSILLAASCSLSTFPPVEPETSPTAASPTAPASGTVPEQPPVTVPPGTTPTAPGTTTSGVPLDCAAFTEPEIAVCGATPTACEITFDDGRGCPLACASGGLGCLSSTDDLACAPDGAEAFACGWTGHDSDYCVCGGPLAMPAEDCTAYPYRPDTLWAERVGFGATATGGDPNLLYRVTTLADSGPGSLRDALEAVDPYWIVFDVDGTIELAYDDEIDIRSDKTVDGRGRDITIVGELRFDDVSNVILSDLRLTNHGADSCGEAPDVILVTGTGCDLAETCTSHDLWFHHLEVFDGGDGLIDLRGATNVTVSWTWFHTHEKAILAWVDSDDVPATGMDLTMHHNWFDRITRRGPQFQFGRAHLFNNYQDEWYEFGAASLSGAQVLSEANVYQARPGNVCVFPCPDPTPCGDSDFVVSKLGLVYDWGDDFGYSKSIGDLALEGAVLAEREPALVFPTGVPYAYTAEPATVALAATVAAGAGPRTDYCP